MYYFFFYDRAPTDIYTLSLHDALPIWFRTKWPSPTKTAPVTLLLTGGTKQTVPERSEEHTSELQSRVDLVCRLLLEKKNTNSPASTPASPTSATASGSSQANNPRVRGH